VIGCSGGRITSVNVVHRSLAFNASDESSLGLLDGLQRIALDFDALTGPVPKWLLNLTSLNYVHFGSNQLTGTVPTELGALSGLQYLYFGVNHLTGTVPTELGALSALNYLNFGINHLTGTLPTELGALSGLTYLDFNYNQLTGTVPPLPFKQYTANCCLSPNDFSCPLPADAAACIGGGKPGVVCK
jgi:Leucine-rich repeat (LRR) protein